MARIIPKSVMEDIRLRNDIVDLIGSNIKLQRAGGTFKALCPFHKEKSPSFIVDPRRQSYHCFGCSAGGDVFSFVQQYENMDFMTAAKWLAERANIRLELEEDVTPGGFDKAALYRIHEGVAQFYRRCLLQLAAAEGARQYLKSRDLDGPIAEAFGIGYAPDRWDTLEGWGKKHEVTPEQLEACGLLMRSSRPDAADRLYDRFRDRIMFPIRDSQGRVVAFSGRIMKAQEKAAKYVNSPETALFKKSRILYALDRARRAIADAGEAIVCEGQIDVIRCHQAGVENAVASQGTAFTEEHARIVSRYADAVVLVFDSDTAGQDAAVKTAGVFMAAGLAVRVAALPPEADPDSFIRAQGGEAFRKLVTDAGSAVRFQVATLGTRERADTEVGAMRIARAVIETIARSSNAVQQARLIEESAELLKLPVKALNDEFNQFMKTAQRRQASAEERTARTPEGEGPRASVAPARSLGPRPGEEVALCEHLAQSGLAPEIVKLVHDCLPLEMLSDPTCREVAAVCLEHAASQRGIVTLLREGGASDEAVRFGAAMEISPNRVTGVDLSPIDAVKDLILRLWKRRFREERAALRQRGEGQLSEADHARLAQLNIDLDSLKSWENGAPIIEIELGG